MGKIVVVGGGSTGIAFAADLFQKGYPVALLEQPGHLERMEELAHIGQIERVGYGPTGSTALMPLSSDPAALLPMADLVFIAAVANRHKELFQWMLPHLQDGQAVCLFNGNCGSILLKQMLGKRRVLVGETVGNYASVRYLGGGKVWYAADPVLPKEVCAFPSCESGPFAERVSFCYPAVCTQVQNVFEAALNTPNVAAHLISSICCLSAMEHSSDFRLYRDGISPSLLRLIRQAEQERGRILDHLGYRACAVAPVVEQCSGNSCPPALEGLRMTTGPDGPEHRYISEDAFAGNSLLLSLGRRFGIQTPLIGAAVAVASALNGIDYYKEGVTLENLGLAELTAAQLNAYLYSGETHTISDGLPA